MQSFAKAILISMISAIFLMMFISLSLFFPWYSTLIIETYNLSQVASGDNYVKQSYYDDALDNLKDRPIFSDKSDKVKITVLNADGRNAVGDDDETNYLSVADHDKPYCQRSKQLTITIAAVYPLQVTLWGRPVEKEIPLSFTFKSVGLKHYKDLDYYY